MSGYNIRPLLNIICFQKIVEKMKRNGQSMSLISAPFHLPRLVVVKTFQSLLTILECSLTLEKWLVKPKHKIQFLCLVTRTDFDEFLES